MRVKRFIAADMRSAIQQVRERLGPDAVILSNRSVDDGVEILASNDYDQKAVSSARQSVAARVRPESSSEANMNGYRQTAEQTPAATSVAENDRWPTTESVFDKRNDVPEDVVHVKSERPFQHEDYARFAVDDQPATMRWPTDDGDVDSMKQELRALRSLLENQMTLMNWHREKQANPVRISLLKRFTELGLTVDVSKQLVSQARDNSDVEAASRIALDNLVNLVPVASDDILSRGGIVALVGPTGVGKTTTIAKLAARYVMSHGRRQVALVTMDNYRIGAQEQLFNFARIIGVPVHSAKDANELHKILQNLYDKKLVLVDTAGMSQRDMRICEQFNTLKKGSAEIRTYLVLAANAQMSALDEVSRSFKQTPISGCILTKIDEAANLGSAISVLIRHHLPLTYMSDGQRVPEDLQPARARDLVAQALALLKKHQERADDEYLAFAFNEGVVHAH